MSYSQIELITFDIISWGLQFSLSDSNLIIFNQTKQRRNFVQNFQAGDDLIFQIESGYGLMRILAIDETSSGEKIWHLSAFNELFLDVEFADMALANPDSLTLNIPHFALTQRAFESTQVARMGNRPLTDEEKKIVENWRQNPASEVSDRSARLMLGLR